MTGLPLGKLWSRLGAFLSGDPLSTLPISLLLQVPLLISGHTTLPQVLPSDPAPAIHGVSLNSSLGNRARFCLRKEKRNEQSNRVSKKYKYVKPPT